MDCQTIIIVAIFIYLLSSSFEGTVAMPGGVLRSPGSGRSTTSTNPIYASQQAVGNADERVQKMLEGSSRNYWHW